MAPLKETAIPMSLTSSHRASLFHAGPEAMSMLAEPRRKQKWSVDPRNSTWTKDDSKFGQKMLEKMGWSKGKGLGAQEQGSTEHIKVQLKNNTLGLGASLKYEDNWIAHQDDFNQLLAELNNCHGAAGSDSPADSKKSFSLEEKSKSSKKRVHYMKFAKGKDLSCRSDTDLACIFGKREKSKKSSQEEADVYSEGSEGKDKESPSTTNDVEPGNTVTSTLSVSEYFAKRLAELKKSRSKNVDCVQQNTKGCLVDNMDSSSEEPKKKRKKKKQNKSDADCPIEPELVENTKEDNSVHKRKKSKNKKNKEIIHSENDNAEDQEEELTRDKKIKKKKNKRSKCTSNIYENKNDSYTPNEDNYAEEPKKKQKK